MDNFVKVMEMRETKKKLFKEAFVEVADELKTISNERAWEIRAHLISDTYSIDVDHKKYSLSREVIIRSSESNSVSSYKASIYNTISKIVEL